MVLRFLLAAVATVALVVSPASAKCTFTGLATAPLKPVVGDGSGTTTPSTPSTPSTPTQPTTDKPADKPGGTTTPSTPSGPAQPQQPQAPTGPDKPPATGSDNTSAPPAGMAGPGFAYYPPGDLVPQDDSRERKGDRYVYFKDIVYPLKLGDGIHPHMNSQIWGHGGGGWLKQKGPGGSECDPPNYDPMLQRDNYCEVRDNDSTHKMPLCPKGYGHQGQDIRPPACPPGTKWHAVAVVDGTIQTVTGFSYLTLKGKDGTVYGYLHMAPSTVKVKPGDKVKQGDVLGAVSNVMDYDAGGTTYHLHFQVKQNIKVGGKVLNTYVPVYTSLIAAYRKSKGLDPGIDKDGNLIVDPALEIGAAKPQPPKPEEKPAQKPAEPKPEPQKTVEEQKPIEPPKPVEKPAEKPAEPENPSPAPAKEEPAPEKKAETPPSTPAPAPPPVADKQPEPPAPAPKPDTAPPAPAPQPAPPAPEKKAEEPPPAPAPAKEQTPAKPAEPAPIPEKKEPEKKAETPPPSPPTPPPAPPKPEVPKPEVPKPEVPKPEVPKPAPSEYPVPPAPAEPPAKTAEPPPSTPAPATPPATPPAAEKPAEAKPSTGWWGSVKTKVGGWWNYWWGKK